MCELATVPIGPAKQITHFVWRYHFGIGLLLYCLTSLVAILGVTFGQEYVIYRTRGLPHRTDLGAAFASWDGQWYRTIAENGYHYDSENASSVAFFPAFPAAGWVLAEVTGLRTEWALLFIAHAALASTFVLLAAYIRERYLNAPPELSGYTLLAFGLWPTSFFFRMTYSESLFLLATVAVLYGLHRRWSLLGLALLIGFATAMRPVAVALLTPFVFATWERAPSKIGCAVRLICLLPVACWGLFGYMIYLGHVFEDPFAFAQTQEFWRRRVATSTFEHIWSLVSLEPLWFVWDPYSWCFGADRYHKHRFI